MAQVLGEEVNKSIIFVLTKGEALLSELITKLKKLQPSYLKEPEINYHYDGYEYFCV